MINREIQVICQNEDGVIWVENESGEIFGIVSASKITDLHGIPYQEDALTVIEKEFDCDIEQDWDNETSTIYTKYKGKLVFSGETVKLV